MYSFYGLSVSVMFWLIPLLDGIINILDLVTIVNIIIGTVGICFVVEKLEQVNENNQWNNYNLLNERYAKLYVQFNDRTKTNGDCNILSKLYFNLSSEEYFLYKNGLISHNMWKYRVLKGIEINLKEYEFLSNGYECWKDKGSFKHPDGFIGIINGKVKLLGNKIWI